ncbi:MAG TPA: VOC family protein [Thermomicrobiales bacterium]|nr:VOC family protein [Thermomicrobiales bacterium]
MASVVRLQHVSIPMPEGGLEQARQFYGDTLGLERKPVPSVLNAEEIIWFRLGGEGDELHVFTERGEPKSPGQHLCMQVDDITAWREMLTSKGVAIEETDHIVNRPRFFIRDPFNNRVEITQVLGDYNDPPVDGGQ